VIGKESCILLKVPGSVFKTIKKEIDNEANAPLEELSEAAESEAAEASESTGQIQEEGVGGFSVGFLLSFLGYSSLFLILLFFFSGQE